VQACANLRRLRHALAGEQRRVEREPFGCDQVETRRAATAVRKQHHVIGDELGSVYLHLDPVTPDGDPVREQVTQLLRGPLGAALLGEREDRIDNDDDEDRDAQLGHPTDDRQDPTHPQQQREEVGQLSEDLADRTRTRGFGNSVGPVTLQSPGGLA